MDCYSPSKIVSFDVYAGTAQSITFELRDANSNVIDDTTISVQTGKIKQSFINCGAACTNLDLNIPNEFFQSAIENAYYLRDRFSYLDIMQYLGCIDKYSKNLI